jgi:hypothetical protein
VICGLLVPVVSWMTHSTTAVLLEYDDSDSFNTPLATSSFLTLSPVLSSLVTHRLDHLIVVVTCLSKLAYN